MFGFLNNSVSYVICQFAEEFFNFGRLGYTVGNAQEDVGFNKVPADYAITDIIRILNCDVKMLFYTVFKHGVTFVVVLPYTDSVTQLFSVSTDIVFSYLHCLY